jgi:hypothetical protein
MIQAASPTRSYREFLAAKSQISGSAGFEPIWLPDCMFPFQRALTEWAIRKGRAAIFADCGLGKTLMQLVWAQNVIENTNKPVLILTPIAVGIQTVKEAAKFGISAVNAKGGEFNRPEIIVTNYERLHLFSSADFGGVVCDESSILKDAKGATKAAIGEFLRLVPYRLLCTATAAPNDWHELGTSSDVLGELGWRDMISTFFKQVTSKDKHGWGRTKYRFREHAKLAFWRWVCAWARTIRKPSDLGFSDDGFSLPPLSVVETVVERRVKKKGVLFDMPADTMEEQHEERRATIPERCEAVAEMVRHDRPAIIWCNLNPEGDLLEKLIPDAVQVSGRDTEDSKERKLIGFSNGDYRKLIIKPKIGAWGMNWQHCCDMTVFPTDSYEQQYQMFRRCWRFGQLNRVNVGMVTTPGQRGITANLERKAGQVEEMFAALVAEMNHSMQINPDDIFPEQEALPSWL